MKGIALADERLREFIKKGRFGMKEIYPIECPPSTTSTEPVIKLEASEAKSSMAPRISFTSARRHMGILLMTF